MNFCMCRNTHLDKCVLFKCFMLLTPQLPCRTKHIHREWNNCQVWDNGRSTSAWGEHSYQSVSGRIWPNPKYAGHQQKILSSVLSEPSSNGWGRQTLLQTAGIHTLSYSDVNIRFDAASNRGNTSPLISLNPLLLNFLNTGWCRRLYFPSAWLSAC